MTQDIDVLIDANQQQIIALCRDFASKEFYVSQEAALDALQRRGQFNVIHAASGNKIDLMIAGADQWGRTELERRRRMKILPDLEGYCARPEDVILSKMAYYREGGSEKHLRDIAGILKVSPDQVDRQFVSHWASRLGLLEIWQTILSRLGY
jgi:hypothetical protein